MKLLKYVTRKTLLACGYPKLETSHPDYGVHAVGAIKVRMTPEVPACQVFYPVDGGNSKRASGDGELLFVPYYRKEAVDGLMDYLNGFGDGILQMLEETPHPLQKTYGVDPLQRDDEKFPLVLFSHGLSGNMEMYTELCAQLASTGCVVVAVEHEDGSASYSSKTMAKDGTIEAIPYKQPLPNAKVPYSRKKVLDFRTPMLEQRVAEFQKIYEYFVAGGNDNDNDAVVQKIRAATDPGKLHLVGHSFGGATQLLAAQTWIESSSSSTMAADTSSMAVVVGETSTTTATLDTATAASITAPIPLSVTVFDAWNFALSDTVLSQGLSADPTVISVVSEGWVATNPETAQTLEFLRNCDPTKTFSYCAKNSVHQSVSDTEAYLPSVVARKLGNRGLLEDRHETIRALVTEFVKRTTGSNNDDTTAQDADADPDPVLVPLPVR